MSEVTSSGPNFSPMPVVPTPAELGFDTDGVIETHPGVEASRVGKDEFLGWCIDEIGAVAADAEARRTALGRLKEYAESAPDVPISDPTYDTLVAAREEADFARAVIAAYASGSALLRTVLDRAGRSEGLQASIFLAGQLPAYYCYYKYDDDDSGTLATAIGASIALAKEMWAQRHGGDPYMPAKLPPAGVRFIDVHSWWMNDHSIEV